VKPAAPASAAAVTRSSRSILPATMTGLEMASQTRRISRGTSPRYLYARRSSPWTCSRSARRLAEVTISSSVPSSTRGWRVAPDHIRHDVRACSAEQAIDFELNGSTCGGKFLLFVQTDDLKVGASPCRPDRISEAFQLGQWQPYIFEADVPHATSQRFVQSGPVHPEWSGHWP